MKKVTVHFNNPELDKVFTNIDIVALRDDVVVLFSHQDSRGDREQTTIPLKNIAYFSEESY